MLKVALMINCEFCRCLFRLSHFTGVDITAWQIHAANLVAIAESEGWLQSLCGNFHYCPTCSADLLAQERSFNGGK